MQAPGIDVRPLRQMTGNAEFNEVYFTDVRLPDMLRIGDVGGGWGVALTTLNNERYMLSEGLSAVPALHQAIRLWNRRTDKSSAAAKALRDELVSLYVDIEVNRLTTIRADVARSHGTAGSEGSVAKLSTAQLNKRITSLGVDLMGADGMLHGSYAIRGIHEDTGEEADAPVRAFLRARANTIEGGTSEILRNILGERVLGLPGDIRVDKNTPWIEGRRS
jgi:alkylation response protein AidB-like acyl-CoA dehydrogenase